MSATYWTFSDRQGWEVVEEGGRYAVLKASNERMRLGADGTLYVGVKSYWFNTLEWAQACKERMEAMDIAFDTRYAVASLSSGSNLGIGFTPSTFKFHATAAGLPKPILTMNAKNEVDYINMPYALHLWIGKPLVRLLKRIWYGDKAMKEAA